MAAFLFIVKQNIINFSCEKPNSFIHFYENPKLDIQNKLNTVHLKQTEENRKIFKTILDIVFLLARQNISFRGHNDGNNSNFFDTQIENH